MENPDRQHTELPSGIARTALGPEQPGFPETPEPSTWDAAYGIDEAVAIPVVPERALVFWELASMIASGLGETAEYVLIRLHLTGETPVREASWNVSPVGRFQDSGLLPGEQYLYVIARVTDGEEEPILVTNPIRMPIRHVPGESELPSSISVPSHVLETVLRRRAGR